MITVTSTTKGEGKSFVSYNLAASYKALGKKVILVGADLRNPQLHTRMGIERENQGLSTYLADENFNDLDALIKKGADTVEMDYLLSGAIPPNPSELLMRPRMKELLERLKERYDIVLIDSAPLLLVSDTTALLPLSDLVVYVSRAQYSDKNIFPFIKELQNRPNIPPFGMVLNGLLQDLAPVINTDTAIATAIATPINTTMAMAMVMEVMRRTNNNSKKIIAI